MKALILGCCFTGSIIIHSTNAWLVSPAMIQHHRPITALADIRGSVSDAGAPVDTDDAMRRDIEAMREEAARRLEALDIRVEEMMLKSLASSSSSQHLSSQEEVRQVSPTEGKQREQQQKPTPTRHIPEEEESRHQETEQHQQQQQHHWLESLIPKKAGDVLEENKKTVVASMTPLRDVTSPSLVQDTRWKLVLKINAAAGGNMEELIGGGHNVGSVAAQKTLMVHLVVDFDSDLLYEDDSSDAAVHRSLVVDAANADNAKASAARTLRVRESWVPAISVTEGRQRSIKIASVGGWKIVPGRKPTTMGGVGIDVLRFYIDVEEEIRNDHAPLRSISDGSSTTAVCPAERIYVTCGIFCLEHRAETEAYKASLRTKLNHLLQCYETLIVEGEAAGDDHDLSLVESGWESIKRFRNKMDLRNQIKAYNEELQQARVRDPEKSLLRISRSGNVGVTREGHVCRRIRRGLNAEYEVLGYMEMASMERNEGEEKEDEILEDNNFNGYLP